jgi:hypothetical protein
MLDTQRRVATALRWRHFTVRRRSWPPPVINAHDMRQTNKIMEYRWCYLLTIVSNLALRSKTQRRIEALPMFNQ